MRSTLAVLTALTLLLWVLAPGQGGDAQAAVPEPAADSAVVSVRTGGDRTGVNAVAGLPGVVLQLFRGANGANPVTEAWGTCTSDDDGDCSFQVPDAQRGGDGTCTAADAGANCGDRFWVRQTSAPAGFFANPTLSTGAVGTGPNPPPTTALAYEFQTPAVYASQTSTTGQPGGSSTFMVSQAQNTGNASSGIWQQSRVDPPLPEQCGLDVAIILDLSLSVGAALPQLKSAADTFVDALTGTPSRMSLFSFSRVSPAAGTQNATAHHPISRTADAAEFKALYAGWALDNATNWDRGIAAAAEANEHYDVAVVITDGNPTLYSDPAQNNGTYTRFREVENGIFSANALKAQGTRVLAVGVGAGVSDPNAALNLQAISGTQPFTGANAETADYYQTADFAAAGEALQSLAFSKCMPSLTVVKAIVPPDGGIEDAVPAGAGWTFTADTADTDVLQGLPETLPTTADGTGAVNFPLAFGVDGSATVTVHEQQQDGYELVPQGEVNASCTLRSAEFPDGTPLEVANDGTDPASPGFSFTMGSATGVSCVVYNRAPTPPATLTVSKTWVVDGVAYPDGEQPPEIDADLWVDPPDGDPAPADGWGAGHQFFQGDTVGLAESVSFGSRDLCELVGATVTVDGAPPPVPFPAAMRDPADPDAPPAVDGFFDVALTAPTTTVEVTNTVTCRTLLTLTKIVLGGGTANPMSWTLSAAGPDGSGPSGPSTAPEVTDVEVTAGAPYVLAEAGGDPRYAQTDLRSTVTQYPGASGSAYCRTVAADDSFVSDVVDGLDGGVLPQLGQRTRCEFLNLTATLSLRKVVENADGEPDPPSAWSLTATPVGDDLPAGLGPVTVTGTAAGLGARFLVRPGVTYELTETAPPDALAGYTLADVRCGAGPVPRAAEPVTVQVDPLAGVLCTFRNVADPSSWTVAKSSDPATGSTVQPGDVITYTITATDLGGGAERPHDLTVTDDLAGVLDDATLDAGSISPSTGTASVTGASLTWSIPLLDGTATLTYRVVVDDDAYAATLTNVVTGGGVQPCPAAEPDCRTTTQVTPPEPVDPTPTPVPPPVSPPGAVPPSGGLPRTGAEIGLTALTAALLVGLGAAVRALRRRPGDKH
ncbi:DUF11 domain-containing protein [Xylanimonas protaetiae]|uniref:VWA domain-containing protein n=1 Tax=Xylanimonas protaetiae TaxID=2509457 RepID=A0A4V0YFZ7_9MICO|nr:DUF11 domain-containing protein [Xylanimonas protaetiae]QAY69451.1 VWA domain-containing protein [Xylanimonas protaetiae]